MKQSILHAACALAGCIGVTFFAMPAQRSLAQEVLQNGVSGAAATGTQKARVCLSAGGGIQAGASPTWSIRVSSDGGSCTHSRHYTGRIGPTQTYTVNVAPTHGQVAQVAIGGVDYITYTPMKGYRGADGFTLVIPNKDIALAYTVEVVP